MSGCRFFHCRGSFVSHRMMCTLQLLDLLVFCPTTGCSVCLKVSGKYGVETCVCFEVLKSLHPWRGVGVWASRPPPPPILVSWFSSGPSSLSKEIPMGSCLRISQIPTVPED